ncbi:MAG: Subversion of eukaryotic traffic protein A [Legionellaceae bacterium]
MFGEINKKDNEFTIPKIIHFIWAGGNKLLPFDHIENIINWGEKNKGWKILLWIDKNSYQGQIDIFLAYKDLFKKVSTVGITFHQTLEETPSNNISIYILDITEQEVVDENIRYEIDKFSPNYGASSDLLRYKILYEYVGAYFDGDIIPGETSLNEIDLVPKKTYSLC